MIEKKIYGSFIVNYRKNTSDEFVLRDSFTNDIFFKHAPEYLPKSSDIIIDVGAHIGTFTLLSSQIASTGKVFAFEPSNDTFNVLLKNIEENKCANVSIFKIALSKFDGTAELYHDLEHGNWGHTLTKKLSDVNETVTTMTLESFFNKNSLAVCNLIKFNCEGSEFDILLNTSKFILDKIQNMIILYHEDLVEHKSTELISFLKSNNFKIAVRNKKPLRGWIIAYKPLRYKGIFVSWLRFYRFFLRPRINSSKIYLVKNVKKVYGFFHLEKV